MLNKEPGCYSEGFLFLRFNFWELHLEQLIITKEGNSLSIFLLANSFMQKFYILVEYGACLLPP